MLKLKVKGCSFIFWNKTGWKRCYQVALQQVSSSNSRKESFVKRLAQTVEHNWDKGSASRTDWFYATVNLILLLVFLCFMLAYFMCNKNLVIFWSTLCCVMNKSTPQIYFTRLLLIFLHETIKYEKKITTWNVQKCWLFCHQIPPHLFKTVCPLFPVWLLREGAWPCRHSVFSENAPFFSALLSEPLLAERLIC